MNRYTYRVEWSAEHGEYVGRCIEMSWLSRWAPTMREATAAIERAVDEFVAEREAAGEDVPRPLTERQYSGKFVVRTSPALHARLVIEATEQNVSMNQWVVQNSPATVDRAWATSSVSISAPVISHVPALCRACHAQPAGTGVTAGAQSGWRVRRGPTPRPTAPRRCRVTARPRWPQTGRSPSRCRP